MTVSRRSARALHVTFAHNARQTNLAIEAVSGSTLATSHAPAFGRPLRVPADLQAFEQPDDNLYAPARMVFRHLTRIAHRAFKSSCLRHVLSPEGLNPTLHHSLAHSRKKLRRPSAPSTVVGAAYPRCNPQSFVTSSPSSAFPTSNASRRRAQIFPGWRARAFANGQPSQVRANESVSLLTARTRPCVTLGLARELKAPIATFVHVCELHAT